MKGRKKRLTWICSLLLCAGCLGGGTVHAQDTTMLVPVGQAIGIKLFSEGLLVVKLSGADGSGSGESPAKACGLRTGDVILECNDECVGTTEEFQAFLTENADKPVSLTVRRGCRTLELIAEPMEQSGTWRLGAWVRDSMAGIGTMTFYDPVSGTFAALGHGITDVDTGALMPLASGEILPAEVKTVKKGSSGDPGELKGEFDQSQRLGQLQTNAVDGIYGTLSEDTMAEFSGKAYPVAEREEISVGKATILSNVAGTTVEEYTIEIERIFHAEGGQRSLLLRVTDPRLLEQTGGIVQGMSGSPILQNGKLVGAVTHVLVDDATRGYGITAEQMLTHL